MSNVEFTKHISHQFNQELENVRQKVLTMGGLVEQQINHALEAFEKMDADFAEDVSSRDKKVNEYEIAIDEECTRILAKRQPAAGDLRLILAIIKTITDLERVGDEADKIARMARHSALSFDDNSIAQQHVSLLRLFAQDISPLLHTSLDAFARFDIDTAVEAALREEKINRQYQTVTEQLMKSMTEHPEAIESIMNIMWSLRALERIGDHAHNICEYVIYLVQGRDVRHLSAVELAQVSRDDN